MFTELLPSNDRGTCMQTHRAPVFRLSGIGGGHRHTQTTRWSHKRSRLKMQLSWVTAGAVSKIPFHKYGSKLNKNIVTWGHKCYLTTMKLSKIKHVCYHCSGCLTCDACHSGNYHHCSNGGVDKITGIYQDGGWAEFCMVPADQVHKLPKNISLQQGIVDMPTNPVRRCSHMEPNIHCH
jgi:hypothetical protein